MSELCVYDCKRTTNNHDQICAACAMDIHLHGYPQHMTSEQFKNFNAEESMRTCEKCGEEAGPRATKCKCGASFTKKEKGKKPFTEVKDPKPAKSIVVRPSDIVVILTAKMSDLEQEIAAIQTAIETIRKYEKGEV